LKLGELFGLLKCRILPPKRMYIMPLASIISNKLMCVACRTCAEKQLKASCTHSDDERALLGTWTTIELELAVAQEYKILEYIEAWHFTESSQYKPATPTSPVDYGLFGSYIINFLLQKTMASGPPDNMRPEEIQEFCLEFSETFGVQLDPTALQNNPVLRSTAKLMLNSICKCWLFNYA
jgi:hypothetical protein